MTRHMSLNIAGALRRRPADMEGMFTENETGRYLTAAECKAYLEQCQTEGKRVLPMGDCDGFDFQTGCPGHPQPD